MMSAQVSTNIYDVLIVSLPGLIAAISSIVMGIINSKKTSENKKSIEKNTVATDKNTAITNENKGAIDENKDAIHKIGKEMNGNLEVLIKAKEKIAFMEGAESINVKDIYKISQQLNDIWKHFKQKALTEAMAKGFIYTHDNQLIVSDKIRIAYQPMLPALKKWYEENKNLRDLELFRDCQQQFGSELIENICKPYNIFDGSCVEIAILLAKETNVK